MAYEMDDIRTSQEIFYFLLEHHEIREETEGRLYQAYAQNEQIQNLVKSQGEAAASSIERYGDVIYLIPHADNYFLGFSRAQLKTLLGRSGATNRDYYLSQFAILTLLVEFYDGQGSSSKSRTFMRAGELQNSISAYLKAGIESSAENEEGDEDDKDDGDLAFQDMYEAYESLKSDDKGSRQKGTKEGFLNHILKFLEKQGLIEYVEEDEMIQTTKKLDSFMDWNLLNQNHFMRVRQVLQRTSV